MRVVLSYGVAASVLCALLLSVLLPLLGPGSRRGALVAALVTLPVQVGLFAVLAHFRNRPRGFIGAWVGGMLGRLAFLGVMTAAVLLRDDLAPAATLLTLAGLLFGLLLLEPLFLGKRDREPGTG